MSPIKLEIQTLPSVLDCYLRIEDDSFQVKMTFCRVIKVISLTCFVKWNIYLEYNPYETHLSTLNQHHPIQLIISNWLKTSTESSVNFSVNLSPIRKCSAP